MLFSAMALGNLFRDHQTHARVISGKWVLKNNLNPDGTMERRKARWVLQGDR
jgi:hypothetical protein